jgi:hypothetical protein
VIKIGGYRKEENEKAEMKEAFMLLTFIVSPLIPFQSYLLSYDTSRPALNAISHK